MTTPEFIYKGLETNRQIRLLDLNLTTDDHNLSASITQNSLDDPELCYIALSYVWGKTVFDHSILLDGRVLPITKSPFVALRTVRRVLGPNRKVWADATCINQKCDTERNQQVLLMREIYHRAESVIAHLSFVASEADLIPGILKSIDLATKKIEVAKSRFLYTFRLHKSQYREYGFPDPSGNEPKILADFLVHPWFRRSWTLQEVAVARSASFICDGWQSTADFTLLTSLISSTSLLQLQYAFDERASRRLVFHLLHGERNAVGETSILQLLHECRSYEATDPRDKMYAFLSMSKDSEVVDLAPNYHEELDDTLRRYAKYFVRNGYGLEMLYDCFAEDIQPALPSWVPRWHSRLWSQANLVASRYSSEEGVVEITLSGDEEVLIVKGFIFDSIKGAGRVYEHSHLDSGMLALRRIMEMKAEIEKLLVGEDSVYATGETIEQAIWRTLTNNGSTNQYPGGENRFMEFFRIYAHVLSRFDTDLAKEGTIGDSDGYIEPESKDEAEIFETIKSFDLVQEWQHAQAYLHQVVSSCQGKRRCVTSRGYLCQVLPKAEVDDTIAFVIGGNIPFVLRPSDMLAGNVQSYKLIGQAYVHGVMHGEVSSKNSVHIENFHVV